MAHLVLATHAHLAESYLETAKMIGGESMVNDVKTFCMTEGKNVDDFMQEVQDYVDLDPEGDYFVMVDLYAASPCTTCVRVFGRYNYRLVTGLNLGMLLEILACKDTCTIEELEEKAIEAGKGGVERFYLHV